MCNRSLKTLRTIMHRSI
uniref:Uncharacterized protein n=1 Tax=Arundo donax TaxID=35708 RepID=A0A0A8ZSV9_ARUDO